MDEFDAAEVATEETTIFLRRLGSGPPLLLLHGFPETHLMWRHVAPLLAARFTVICPDLRGYGRSGGRVAYRLALDHPHRVTRLAVLDIVPTAEVWDRADERFARAFWPWSLLAQPAPLPEKLISAAPDAVVDSALGGWGSPLAAFEATVRAAYVDALRDEARVHAICEEYRAAATLDRQHDAQDRDLGRRIRCPVLALWSAGSSLDTWYARDGGPLGILGIWRNWADDVEGQALQAGHFFPEETPELTAELLDRFFSADCAA